MPQRKDATLVLSVQKIIQELNQGKNGILLFV